jgi:quercetin dioxygenase-like cupin family protein
MIDSVPYLVKEGDFIILPAGIPHSLIATKPYKMLLTVVKK